MSCIRAAMSREEKWRFNRALTPDEVDGILSTLEREGPAAAFIAMWDVILLDAEGCTWREAGEQGREFSVTDYAIPSAQETQLRDAMRKGRRRDLRMKIAWTWFEFGPTSSDEPS